MPWPFDGKGMTNNTDLMNWYMYKTSFPRLHFALMRLLQVLGIYSCYNPTSPFVLTSMAGWDQHRQEVSCLLYSELGQL